MRAWGRSAAGERASWDPAARTVAGLASPGATGVEKTPGASAQREDERRHERREQHAREKLEILGVALARVIDEPQSTTSWRQGARGEQRTAARLANHLEGNPPVKLLHDRRIPGRGRADIDHLTVGPGGVTAIDSARPAGTLARAPG